MKKTKTPSLFGRNLSFLARFYPAEAERVQRIAADFQSGHRPLPYRLVPSGNEYLCRSARSGREEWIHGPDPPSAMMSRMLAALSVYPEAHAIVYRAGLGYLASRVFHETKQRLSIIEPDEDLFTLSLDVTDWRPVLGAPRCLLVLGSEAVRRFVQLMGANPRALTATWLIVPGIESTPAINDEAANLDADLYEIREGSDSPSAEHSETERTLDFLLHGPPTTTGFSSGFMEAAAKLGIRSLWRSSDDARFRFLCGAPGWTSFLEGYRPAFVLGLNRGGLPQPAEKALGDLEVPQALHFLEDPDWYDPEPEHWALFRRVYVFDPTHGKRLESLGLNNRRFLPFGALLSPPQFIPPWMGDRRYAITFVGSSGLNRESGRYFEQIERSRPGIRAQCEPLIEGCLQHGATWLREQLFKDDRFADLGSQGLLLKMIEEEATLRSHRAFLTAVAEQPLTLFGDAGWGITRHSESLTRNYAGRALRYPSETAAVYARSDININLFHLQCERSLNARVYDVMACGGFLLCQYSPAVEEMFRIGEHLETFSSPAEMQEKVRYYLSHPDERREIARQGQAEVLAHHTIQHRLQTILRDFGVTG